MSAGRTRRRPTPSPTRGVVGTRCSSSRRTRDVAADYRRTQPADRTLDEAAGLPPQEIESELIQAGQVPGLPFLKMVDRVAFQRKAVSRRSARPRATAGGAARAFVGSVWLPVILIETRRAPVRAATEMKQ